MSQICMSKLWGMGQWAFKGQTLDVRCFSQLSKLLVSAASPESWIWIDTIVCSLLRGGQDSSLCVCGGEWSGLFFRKIATLVHGPFSPSLNLKQGSLLASLTRHRIYTEKQTWRGFGTVWGSKRTSSHQYGQLPKYNSLKWKGQREVRKA